MKLHLIAVGLLAMVTVIGTASCSKQAEDVPGKQTYCPVMQGNRIDPKLFVDAEGKRIYVCCPGCIAQVKADPEKYLSKMETAGVILEDAPAE